MKLVKYAKAYAAMNLYGGKTLAHIIKEGTVLDLYQYRAEPEDIIPNAGTEQPKDMYLIYFPRLKTPQGFFDAECFKHIMPYGDSVLEKRLETLKKHTAEYVGTQMTGDGDAGAAVYVMSTQNGETVGAIVEKTTSSKKTGTEVCSTCGKKVPDARFCLYCASPLSDGMGLMYL